MAGIVLRSSTGGRIGPVAEERQPAILSLDAVRTALILHGEGARVSARRRAGHHAQGLQHAMSVAAALYARGATMDAFPHEAPWTRAIPTSPAAIGRAVGLDEERARKALRLLAAAGVIISDPGAAEFAREQFTPFAFADLLDWGEIAAFLEGRPSRWTTFLALLNLLGDHALAWERHGDRGDIRVHDNPEAIPSHERRLVRQEEIEAVTRLARGTVQPVMVDFVKAGLIVAAGKKEDRRGRLYILAPRFLRRAAAESSGLAIRDQIEAVSEQAPNATQAEHAVPPAPGLHDTLRVVVIEGSRVEAPLGAVVEMRVGKRHFRVTLKEP